MVNNKTYNNVVNTLLRLGQYHDQISTTSVGDIYDINLEKMEKFPLMHINPTSVNTGDSQLTYNFQIFIMDMVSEKSDWQNKQHELLTKLVDRENNEQEVQNQEEQKLSSTKQYLLNETNNVFKNNFIK